MLLAAFLTACTPGPSAAALAIDAIPPPTVIGPLEKAPPAIRIGIAGHVVYLDPAPWLAAKPNADTPLPADSIATFDPANSEQLALVLEQWQIAARIANADLAIELRADAETPFQEVMAVMRTTSRSGFDENWLDATSEGVLGALSLFNGCQMPYKPCVSVSLLLTQKGLIVHPHAIMGQLISDIAPQAITSAPPAWNDHVLRDETGECRIPLANPTALRALISQTTFPICSGALSAEPETRWGDVLAAWALAQSVVKPLYFDPHFLIGTPTCDTPDPHKAMDEAAVLAAALNALNAAEAPQPVTPMPP